MTRLNMKVHDLQVELRGISTLRSRRSNPRTHSKKQLRQIADSIRTFGFTNPVLLDDAGGVIAGHGRIEAAKLLGLTEVPTIRLEDMS
jgi:ParB-like chromosome segregation protein Spo0J